MFNKLPKIFHIICIGIALSISACSLDVLNNNDPNINDVFSEKNDVEVALKSIYLTYWQAVHSTNVQLPALVAADQFTASWGNFGWQQISNEPRKEYDNSVEGSYNSDNVSQDFYFDMTSALSLTNNLLLKLNDGMLLGKNGERNTRYKALCYHIQGLIMGQLALTYDKGQAVSEYTKTGTAPFIDYKQLMDTAITKLTKCIAICNSNTFSFPVDDEIINGIVINNKVLRALSHSYIARFLVLNARDTVEDNEPTHWQLIYNHADSSITNDFGPLGQTTLGKWYDLNYRFLTLYGWARVDNRIINLMDPTYPKRYPKDSIGVLHPGYRAGVAISDDNRLEEYFEYLPSVNFDPNRGKYHFSHYRLKRYDNSMLISEGQLIEMRAYEMYLYQAEYYLKSEHKSISLAKRILNDPSLPRISKNPDWSARLSSVTDPKKILDIIYYERDIELMGQGFLLGFCDMRRREMLQRGTIIHFPIPGKELEVLGMKYYTFGGPQRIGVNNEGTSSGGWLKDEDYNY